MSTCLEHRPFVRTLAAITVVAGAGVITAAGTARTNAVPRNVSPPTTSGDAREGDTLTARNGAWSNNPTSFAYQWQQCAASGTGCSDINGATRQTYTPTSSDVDHALRVAVTGSNADGQSSTNSSPTGAVSSKNEPTNTATPTISGTAKVGEELRATIGTWSGGVQSFAFQWQRCDSSGSGCTDVTDATARTYGVRSIDAGQTVRVVVTAQNATGSSSATSEATDGVRSAAPVVRANRAPRIAFLSLRRVGIRLYARFRVCDDSPKSVTVVERDNKAGVLSYTRRFSVVPTPCATHSRSWRPALRFRSGGKLVVTLRAIDKSGRFSTAVSRSLFR